MKKIKKAPLKNPFEVHINKQKMVVLGQKLKNDRGLPGVSRAKAIKKRKQTLLQEYKLQHKSNQFKDKRIGERSKDLSSEDKLIARFTAIRKKAHKKSIYNLADDEVLTHKGQTLTEIEKFDDPRSDDDEEDDKNLDSSFVEDAHFGGGVLTKTGKEGVKTHKELIEELIAESKKRKAEKQKIKEATLELTEKLDTEWKDLLPLVSKNKKNEEQEVKQIDDYDKVMRELKFEARGSVSDRMKTEKEIVEEEKEKLEELEKERLRRMKGEENEKKLTHRSADDLDDDFVYQSDTEYMLSYNEKGEANVEVEAEIDDRVVGENVEEEEEQEEEEEENDSEDNLSDLKEESSDESESEIEEITKIKSPETNDSITELPYTFTIPENYEELQKLLKNHSTKNLSVIMTRMIKCNHPSLDAKNKQNLKLLFVYLLQFLNDSVQDIAQCFQIFSALAPHLYDLTQIDKENSYFSIKEVIKEKHEEYKKNRKKYPGLEILIFFKLVSLLFSTSDFRHQVVTPCFVFMEQMMNKCKVNGRRDIAYGLFLVTLVLEYTTLSKRFLPSAINFLAGILHMSIPKVGVKLIKVNRPFQANSNLLVLAEDHSNDSKNDLKMEVTDFVEKDIDDDFKIRTLITTLKLVEEFDNNLTNLPSNVEIFKDILIYLELLPTKNYPKNVCAQYEKISQQLKSRKINRKIDYVVMEKERPKALRLYEPKIEEVFEGRKRKIQSKEKAERAKLLNKLKKETKGALREIRRDRAFLGRVKLQQRIQSDNERKEKVKRIYSEAAIQQSELNAIERKKKRK